MRLPSSKPVKGSAIETCKDVPCSGDPAKPHVVDTRIEIGYVPPVGQRHDEACDVELTPFSTAAGKICALAVVGHDFFD
jgi:hypothetical protein